MNDPTRQDSDNDLGPVLPSSQPIPSPTFDAVNEVSAGESPYVSAKPLGSAAAPVTQIPLPSLPTRITWLVHGVALPALLLCWSLTGMQATGDQPWQSGEGKMYVAMLLRPIAWWVFAPAMLYCMTSLTILSIVPSKANKLWVHMGIYTGVPLAIHFGVLLLVIHEGSMLVLAFFTWLVWHGLIRLVFYIFKPRRQFHLWHIMAATTIVAVLIVIFQQTSYQILYFPAGAFFALTFSTPVLNMIAYFHAATCAWYNERSRYSPFKLIAIAAAWTVTWLAGWRYAVLVMMDEYNQLPVANPNCYLANAAACAHPRLTGAQQRGQVTHCMRRLKFIELVFKATAPALHRRTRQLYDCWCPPLAAYCQQHHWLATVTCLALKPLELFAELARLALRIPHRSLNKMYSPIHTTQQPVDQAPVGQAR